MNDVIATTAQYDLHKVICSYAVTVRSSNFPPKFWILRGVPPRELNFVLMLVLLVRKTKSLKLKAETPKRKPPRQALTVTPILIYTIRMFSVQAV